MKIEILFPELCSLFGDHGNIIFLEKVFGEENIIKTSILEKARFLTEDIALIYMGSMSEKTQIQVLKKLGPDRELLIEKLDAGMKALFTGNALDVLGRSIIEEDGSEIKALDVLNFRTVIKRSPRLNSTILGRYGDLEVIGHKSQFTQIYTEDQDKYFIELEKGMGINKESNFEGFTYKNLIGTHIIGPFLPLNPLFSEQFLEEKIPFKETLVEAYNKKLSDIRSFKEL